jgi:predicted permease
MELADGVFREITQALRRMRRAPGLSLAIVTTLGLALAASVATFSVLNAILLEKLPYRDPDRVLFLEHGYADMAGSCSPPTFLDHRRDTRVFASVSATRPWDANLTGAGEPERVRGLLASADFFQTLGATAWRGRTFLPEEEQPGREHVVVLGHGLWQRRFGADPAVLGSTLRLNGEAYQVVGIMPPGFEWGRHYGLEARAEIWAPFALTPGRVAESSRGDEYLDVYGRLRPGVTLPQAQADMDRFVRGLRARFPDRYTTVAGLYVKAVPLRDAIVGPMRAGLLLVSAAVASLLLGAAVNVAGLLLARASGRRRETSLRAALGASRARLAREVLAEASVLAAVAGGGGLLLARLLAGALDRIDPVTLPRSQPIAVDARVACFALAATLLAALVSGLVPAWHLSRSDLMAALRTGLQGTGGRETARTRRGLIVVQTAIALALLVGTGLLARSLAELQKVPAGFRTRGVLAAQVPLPRARYGDAANRARFLDDVLARLTDRPGVVAAGAVSELPLSGSRNSSSFYIEGRALRSDEKEPHAETWSASPGYFAALGVALQRGRVFDARDVAGRTATTVVSESLVRRYFPGEDPLGRRIDFEGSEQEHRWREIVGVVADVRDRALDRAPEPQVYVPYAQRPTGAVFLVVRGAESPLAALPPLRLAVRDVDPELPVYNATTMDRLVGADLQERRAARAALGGFAAAALALAALGLYGLLAQTVRERVPEIGVRMALGARRADVVRLFLGEGGRLVLAGLAAGAAVALAGTRLLRSLLFGVSPADPATYAIGAALLAVVSLAAGAVPAWRASRVDPLRALRSE